MSLKIAIVGAAPSSRDLAPFSDETWEIWACSPSNRDLPRITAWFELHALADLRSKRWENWARPYGEWLKEQPRVYMQEKNEIAPNALVFPKDEIIERFGSTLLTSSIAWETAFAIFLGAEEIGMWGVNMSAGSEYAYERPGCVYWIEKARTAGIKVTIPPQADIDFPVPLYGFDDASPLAIRLKQQAFDLRGLIDDKAKRMAAIDEEKLHLLQEYARLMGCLSQLDWLRQSFVSNSGPDLQT